MEENILQIKNLTKRFGSKLALDDITFDIKKGSTCGLLGPNGAGKTTLLRIINAIMVSDAGSVKVNGVPVSLKTTKYFGYMPEERGLYDKMRIEDQIIFFGKLKGGNERRMRIVMEEYLELFKLSGERRRRLKELSKGNQQKVQIISTLVHEPDIVILDEPFSGFDPINGAILQQLLERLHEKKVTVMLSSHNMPAIEEMCDDIVLINQGKLLVNDSITGLKEKNKDNSLLLTSTTELNTKALLDSGKVTEVSQKQINHKRKGYTYRIIKSPIVRNTEILDLISFQSEVVHFEEALPSLTDIFMKYTVNPH